MEKTKTTELNYFRISIFVISELQKITFFSNQHLIVLKYKQTQHEKNTLSL